MGNRVGDYIIDGELKHELIKVRKSYRNSFFKKIYNPFFKRLADILFAVVALVLLLIFLPFVAVAIKIDSKGPVFFKQLRVGKYGRLFMIYKFRTMYHNTEHMIDNATFDEHNNPFIQSENDVRVTKVGRFLRRHSIDELPQVFCIIKGDMSFIGPRAWIPEETVKLSNKQLYRLTVKPGLTGYAQIGGRNKLPLDERIEKDLHYIKNMSAWLDIKILFMTIISAVILQDGAF